MSPVRRGDWLRQAGTCTPELTCLMLVASCHGTFRLQRPPTRHCGVWCNQLRRTDFVRVSCPASRCRRPAQMGDRRPQRRTNLMPLRSTPVPMLSRSSPMHPMPKQWLVWWLTLGSSFRPLVRMPCMAANSWLPLPPQEPTTAISRVNLSGCRR